MVSGCPLQRALANHRNSVTLHDWSISSKGNDIHEILIVMQLYDGGTVLEMMNARLDRGFTEHEVLRIFTDVLLAVTRLHHRTKSIIHRDLKVCLIVTMVSSVCNFNCNLVGLYLGWGLGLGPVAYNLRQP